MSSRRDRAKKELTRIVNDFEVAGLVHGFGLVQPKTPDEEGHYVLRLSREPTVAEQARLPKVCQGFEVRHTVCPAI